MMPICHGVITKNNTIRKRRGRNMAKISTSSRASVKTAVAA